MKVKKTVYVEPNTTNIAAAEAFGISGMREFELFNLEIPTDWDVLYITGESGSGKTSIARELGMGEPQQIDTKKIICEGLNLPLKESLEVLSAVGLSDASAFLTTYENLSDSQQARFRIAYEVVNTTGIVFVDEFLSTLDRETAKPVAYAVQKFVRRLNRKLVCITAHNDLEPYLKPDYTITGTAYPSTFKVTKVVQNDSNPFVNLITIRYSDKDEYRNLRLGELHYKGKYTGGVKEIVMADIGDRTVGTLVSTNRIADDGRKISRLVVHPTYRGIGVGQLLVEKYLEDYPNTSTVTSMGLFNPVFERAGMQRVEDYELTPKKETRDTLRASGFRLDKWYDVSYCQDWCETSTNRAIVAQLFAKQSNKLVQPGGAKLSAEEVAQKIKGDKRTAGRVLWASRPKRMARYVSKKNYHPYKK